MKHNLLGAKSSICAALLSNGFFAEVSDKKLMDIRHQGEKPKPKGNTKSRYLFVRWNYC